MSRIRHVRPQGENRTCRVFLVHSDLNIASNDGPNNENVNAYAKYYLYIYVYIFCLIYIDGAREIIEMIYSQDFRAT